MLPPCPAWTECQHSTSSGEDVTGDEQTIYLCIALHRCRQAHLLRAVLPALWKLDVSLLSIVRESVFAQRGAK